MYCAMCPGLRDMWGIYAVEVRHVSGVEGHVGQKGVEARHESGSEGHVGHVGRRGAPCVLVLGTCGADTVLKRAMCPGLRDRWGI